MNEVEKIEDQMRRSFSGNAWHGPALATLLEDVDAAAAVARPVAGAHNIWEIALHLNAWHREVHLRIAGGDAQALSPDQDWPAVGGVNAANWDATRRELAHTHDSLCKAVLRLDDAELGRKAPGADYTLYTLLHGVVHHDLYHAGQIALLKKS